MVFLINSMGEGGAQRILLSLVEEYLSSGMEVTVILLAKNDFYQLPLNTHKVYLYEKSDKGSSLLQTLFIPYYAWKLKKYVKNRKIKTIQSHLFRANYVNLLSKFFFSKHKVQVVNHSVISRFFQEGISGKINLFLIKVLYPKADKTIYISKRMKEDFLRYMNKINNKNKVIYNPYDISMILDKSRQRDESFTFDGTKQYLITVGRLIPLKRFEDVLHVLATLEDNIELIMLGDGKCMVKLRSLAEALNISSRIHLIGQVKNPFFYIANSDLLVSSSSVEGFPNVLVEAMICRTTVVSSDCISGPREILAPNTNHSYQLKEGIEMAEFGLLYGVGDIDALKNSIQLLLNDEVLRKDYEDKAFNQSKSLSIKKIAKIYEEAYFQ